MKIRVAGTLILLFGVTITRVSTVTTDDITTTNDGDTAITIGAKPIPLPPRLATLVTRLAAEARSPSTLRNPNPRPWLFPGRPPTRPTSPSAFSRILHQHGITPHVGRNAALIDLAGDLPAPVLADILGLNASTTAKWARRTKRDWTGYLAARLDQTTQQ
jgi:hypothetical protein